MTPSQQVRSHRQCWAKGRGGRFKLHMHKHADQHHHCRSLILEKFSLHLDIEIHESKILSASVYLLHQHVHSTARNYLLVFRKRKIILQHTESRSMLCILEKGKWVLTPANTHPVSWSQLFLQ